MIALDSSIPPGRGNYSSYGLFSTQYFPINIKSEDHEFLVLMFHNYGMSPACVMDGDKDQTLGQFMKNLKYSSCQLKQTETYSQWHNYAKD